MWADNLPAHGVGRSRGVGSIRAVLCSALTLFLFACAGSPPAPVEDRQARSNTYAAASGYTVPRGDTLYSIAFRYGLDYRRLGAANGISYPYTIFVGQRLQLREADLPKAASRAAVTRPLSPAPKPASSKPDPVSKPSSPPVSANSAPVVPPLARPVVGGPVKAWRWPTTGKVVRRYSSTLHKGIDIGGERGDDVQAVAAGQVVYAGTGIVGLGELIIVKHNEVYLSAYGHNQRLLVAEGDVVKAGQKIAEKGSSGTDSVRLHFEIRKEGKPIDPLRLLPRR